MKTGYLERKRQVEDGTQSEKSRWKRKATAHRPAAGSLPPKSSSQTTPTNNHAKKKNKKSISRCKTYSSRDSRVVTHRSTNLPFN
ncbi:hypothetical protein KCU90_g4762, partial [Aureobasidium melanogenum]